MDAANRGSSSPANFPRQASLDRSTLHQFKGFHCGGYLDQSKGVPIDFERAAHYFRLMADQGLMVHAIGSCFSAKTNAVLFCGRFGSRSLITTAFSRTCRSIAAVCSAMRM
jgi:hypothetical protein